jgi:hypothetical protein
VAGFDSGNKSGAIRHDSHKPDLLFLLRNAIFEIKKAILLYDQACVALSSIVILF